MEIGDYLERIFPLLGVRLIAVNDGYDSDDYKGTTGGFDVVMKCIMNALYSRDLSVKVKTALHIRACKGQFRASYAPYGYLKDPENRHHLVPDPVAAQVVRRIFAMAAGGTSSAGIAKALNRDHVESPAAHMHRLYPESKLFVIDAPHKRDWTATSVYKVITRLEYTGAVVNHRAQCKGLDSPHHRKLDRSEWIIVPNCHEAIVSEETYQKAQEAIRSIKKVPRGSNAYLLKSLVRCGVCGRIMTRHNHAKTRNYYVCDKSRYAEKTDCPLGEHFYEDELESIVLRSLSQLLQTIVDRDRRMRKAAARSSGSVEYIRRSILRIEQSIRQDGVEKMSAYENYSDGKMSKDDFIRQKNELVENIEKLTAEKQTLTEQLTVLEQTQSSELHEYAEDALEFLNTSDVTNDMLSKFIDRVNVFSGSCVEIVYRFTTPFMESLAELQSGQTKEPLK